MSQNTGPIRRPGRQGNDMDDYGARCDREGCIAGLKRAAEICRTMGGNHRDSMIRDICVNCSRSILAEAQKLEGQ